MSIQQLLFLNLLAQNAPRLFRLLFALTVATGVFIASLFNPQIGTAVAAIGGVYLLVKFLLFR